MSAVIRIAESAARAVTLAATAPFTTGHMCRPCGTESGPVRHAQGGKHGGHLPPVTPAVMQISSLQTVVAPLFE